MNPQKLIKQLKTEAASILENRENLSAEAFANLKKGAEEMLKRAARLQVEHNIADSELKPQDETIGGLAFVVPVSLRQNVRAVWFELLCQSVGNIIDVRFGFAGKLTGNTCQIFGNETDATTAFELLTSLCDKLALFFQTLRETKEDLKKFDYALGFSVAINTTSEAEKAKQEAANHEKNKVAGLLEAHETALVPTNGLALRNNKLAKIDAVLHNLGAQAADKRAWNDASESFKEGYHDGLRKDKTRL